MRYFNTMRHRGRDIPIVGWVRKTLHRPMRNYSSGMLYAVGANNKSVIDAKYCTLRDDGALEEWRDSPVEYMHCFTPLGRQLVVDDGRIEVGNAQRLQKGIRSAGRVTVNKVYTLFQDPATDKLYIRDDVGDWMQPALQMERFWRWGTHRDMPCAMPDLGEYNTAGHLYLYDSASSSPTDITEDTTMKIEIKNVLMINDRPAAEYNAEALMELIRKQKDDLASLEDVGVDSKYIASQKQQIVKTIAELVEILDGRVSE